MHVFKVLAHEGTSYELEALHPATAYDLTICLPSHLDEGGLRLQVDLQPAGGDTMNLPVGSTIRIIFLEGGDVCPSPPRPPQSGERSEEVFTHKKPLFTNQELSELKVYGPYAEVA